MEPDAVDPYRRSVRRCVQEIITAQVVHKDIGRRDQLIDEYVDEHGVEIAKCATGFIHTYAVDDVADEVAQDRFYYLLKRTGDLMRLVAEMDDTDEQAVVLWMASQDYHFSEDEEENASPQGVRAIEAMRAVQTCLVANYFVRRGEAPWGIQKSLEIAEMRVVVQYLGVMLFEIVECFEADHQTRLVRTLLEDVEHILRTMAHHHGQPVSELVSSYFTFLSARDPD